MFVKVSTQLNCTESELWEKIIKLDSLQFVAAPLLAFKAVDSNSQNSTWELGRDYPFKLYLFKYIPLGSHTIQLVKLDKNQNLILSHESGQLTPVWNHKIYFKELQSGVVSYTDEIEIGAGWLTPAIGIFAHLFYRHRQRRWKALLRK
ncbi:MAG: hypothetical protein CSA49_07030 [Gammaproteobacteria bacterium]|nr:MAG: hypothetical protein CSA49_07030 [Gammaproteobacteria bacterium]